MLLLFVFGSVRVSGVTVLRVGASGVAVPLFGTLGVASGVTPPNS